MTTGPRSQCAACVRYRSFDAEHPTSWCAAFPDGIPDAVFFGELDHRQPVDGDHGIRFLAKPGDSFPPYALATA